MNIVDRVEKGDWLRVTMDAKPVKNASARCLSPFSTVFLPLVAALAILVGSSHPAAAQEAAAEPEGVTQGEQAAEAALAEGEKEAAAEQDAGASGDASKPKVTKQINLLELLMDGGYLMLPIAAMSLLVVTFGVERTLGLRRHKILPPELVGGLGEMAGQKGGLDPRKAYKLCQQYPSAAADVIKTMLLKVGRPHTEVEHTVSEANDREAARLYSNVRWLSLAAGVSPLLGLLGTVWGMIQAFFATANLPTGANKAQSLADGIYVALVTTFAGLAVAIPAAVLAHVFEGRIQALFRELDEMLLGLMPQMERFEGRLRVSKDQMTNGTSRARADGDTTQRTENPQAAPAPK